MNPFDKEEKHQALELTRHAEVCILPSPKPQQSFWTKMMSKIKRTDISQEEPTNVVITPLTKYIILVANNYDIHAIFYSIDAQNQTIITEKKTVQLHQRIHYVVCWTNIEKCTELKRRHFIICSINRVYLFTLDATTMQQTDSIYIQSLINVYFITKNRLMFINRGGQINYYEIRRNQFHKKNIKEVLKCVGELLGNDILAGCRTVGSFQQREEGKVMIFSEVQHANKTRTIYVQEVIVTAEEEIKIGESFKVMNTQQRLSQGNWVVQINEYYCIELTYAIIIVAKKYGRYLKLDVISNINPSNTSNIGRGGLVRCYGKNNPYLSLYAVVIQASRCTNKLLDTLQLPEESINFVKKSWYYTKGETWQIVVAWENETNFCVAHVLRKDSLSKVMNLAKKNGEYTLEMDIEFLLGVAAGLKISEEDFYWNMWIRSPQGIKQIHKLLLPIRNINKIKKQLGNCLKQRKIAVTDLNKILKEINRIIQSKLKNDLKAETIWEYIKNDFLLRKIMLKQNNSAIDFDKFQDTVNTDLASLFLRIIADEKVKDAPVLEQIHSMKEVYVPQKYNLSNVFQQMRLIILQDYKQFLLSILNRLNSDQFYSALSRNEFLIGIAPVRVRGWNYDAQYTEQSQLSKKILLEQSNQFTNFYDLKQTQYDTHMSCVRIERQLRPFHSTSRIKAQLIYLTENLAKPAYRLEKHALLSPTFEEYKLRLQQISGLTLHFAVLENFNRRYRHSADADFQKLLALLDTKHVPRVEDKRTLQLYGRMHRFMLSHGFGDHFLTCTELQHMGSIKTVEMFFLKDKQNINLLFRDFRQLYKKSQCNVYEKQKQFLTLINEYIAADSCTLTELQTCLDHLDALEESIRTELFQIILNGFCLKLVIADHEKMSVLMQKFTDPIITKSTKMQIESIKRIIKFVSFFEEMNLSNHRFQFLVGEQGMDNLLNELLSQHNPYGPDVLVQVGEEAHMLHKQMGLILKKVHEKVYPQYCKEKMFKAYGEHLIDYKHFDLLKDVARLAAPDDQQRFYDALIDEYLDKWERGEEETVYDEKAVQQLTRILTLYPSTRPHVHHSKLALASMKVSWGYEMGFEELSDLVKAWIDSPEKRPDILSSFFLQSNQSFNFNFTLEQFQRAYNHFNEAIKIAYNIHQPQTDPLELFKAGMLLSEKLKNLDKYFESLLVLCELQQDYRDKIDRFYSAEIILNCLEQKIISWGDKNDEFLVHKVMDCFLDQRQNKRFFRKILSVLNEREQEQDSEIEKRIKISSNDIWRDVVFCLSENEETKMNKNAVESKRVKQIVKQSSLISNLKTYFWTAVALKDPYTFDQSFLLTLPLAKIMEGQRSNQIGQLQEPLQQILQYLKEDTGKALSQKEHIKLAELQKKPIFKVYF